MSPATISQLYIYPVKSLAGIAVDSITVTAQGLAHDREWMIVDDSGRYITQRELPQMARIQVALTDKGIRLAHPTADDLLVPNPPPDTPVEQVRVWKDFCLAQAAGPSVHRWLNEILDYRQDLRLVRFAPGFIRPGMPERFGDATTRFADAAPFLIVNQHSLDALNLHLHREGLNSVDMRRFRPNIVATGIPAFAEHAMSQLQLRDSPLRWELCDACQRCSIITVDPDTGERTPQIVPFKQVTAINPAPGNPRAPAFGINARLLAGAGTHISVGSPVIWQ